jgi:hypothetical protein
MKRDSKVSEANSDRTNITMNSSYSYIDGSFLQPDRTAVQMQEFSEDRLREMGFPGFLAGFLIKGIHKPKGCQAE